jgi:hypothetical protein
MLADGLTLVTVGASFVTVNPADNVPWPEGSTTVTNLVPIKARLAITTLAAICVSLMALKPVTLMPAPKDTVVAPAKLVPVRVTEYV